MRNSGTRRVLLAAFALMLLAAVAPASAEQGAAEPSGGNYLIQPGDVLRISVWKEEDLQQDLLVRPDGWFSFPLAGEIVAGGRTVSAVQADLIERIEEYIPDPVVTVQVLNTDGNVIYVLGKVNRPGAYVMSRPLDVTQALALAGGLATFADEDDISVLRRQGGRQPTVAFDYGDVQYGRDLDQNVLLQPGDVVIVP